MSRIITHDDPEGRRPPANGYKWYLCHWAHKLLDFRQAELEAVAGMFGVPRDQMVFRQPPSDPPHMMPFWYVTLPNDDVARHILSRTMLTKAFYEIWGEGSDWEELAASIASYPEESKAPWLGPELSFKVVVASYGGTCTMQQQLEYMEKVSYIPFQGPVSLKAPDVTYWLQVVDCKDTPGLGLEVLPPRIYFGRKVGEYNHIVAQVEYSLKTRPYIGPTSMDAEMAFIMCNQAQVRRSQLVLDPYVGTGSIAVAAAHHGAHVMGADIDVRVVRMGKTDAQGRTLDVFSNFDHYKTRGRLGGLMRLDMHRHPFRGDLEGTFHAIVGDPPYGVRAGGKKSVAKEVVIHDRETHIPATGAYNLGECLRDLLDFAARTLVVGGRLVYFLPATPDTYREEEIPTHPCLTLTHNSEQLLTARYSRRLITMVKVMAYDAAAAAAHHDANPDPTMAIDRIHDLVYEQYERDEKGKVIYPEGALNRKKHRGKML
mmetsp:Transcript_22265/g.56648  ORF Transcript_22265/g.56648 Transcript_22265/m.56648 type:complete len:486 (-) Transcript_22265:551-2008(-)|eukprot:CAMPEP_0202874478 /NCGR_PEP_ID=MMETSP1391-20130828/25473_1 /ASSEMBLY_ACC=CAM_ASM_000867 /TAXON_ID=1034604 /ORGANISM="Chlamydomonas leiostraca, Strain SAG 11-49" /LENGTH=485 /DNA_ID=CAMNT_0049555923 /DNA_START=50 /DNA_END=1507 /DNA_ORIENTATION=-